MNESDLNEEILDLTISLSRLVEANEERSDVVIDTNDDSVVDCD